jgi:ribonuclease R
MVHVGTLADDYYYYEEATHSLTGQRGGQRYRLGDKVRVAAARRFTATVVGFPAC